MLCFTLVNRCRISHVINNNIRVVQLSELQNKMFHINNAIHVKYLSFCISNLNI